MADESTALSMPVPPVDPERVEMTVKVLLTGQRDFDVIQTILRMWPGQDVAALVVACMASLADSGRGAPDVVRGWCVEATKAVYRKCVESGEWSAALKAIKQIHELTSR